MQHVSPELSWQITVEEKSKSPDCICETWPRSIRHGVLFFTGGPSSSGGDQLGGGGGGEEEES